MIYHNNTMSLNVQNFIPPVLDFSEQLSLQDLKRCNAQDCHWLHLKLEKLEKHIHQIEVYIAYELKDVNVCIKKRLRVINALYNDVNADFIKLNYYDEKSKNILLADIEDSLTKLKKFVLSLEADISTYSTH